MEKADQKIMADVIEDVSKQWLEAKCDAMLYGTGFMIIDKDGFRHISPLEALNISSAIMDKS